MNYSAGDTVVHPQHGTATVEGIVTKDLGDGPEDYLELYVESGSMKVMVPAAAVAEVGIRSLSTRDEAQRILALLEEPSEVPEAWADRNASTAARVKSRELDQVAMVVRDLSRHQEMAAKPLTVGERAILSSCLDILSKELGLALELSQDDTKALIVETSVRQAAPTT